MRLRIYTTACSLTRIGLALAFVCLLSTRVMAQSYTEGFNNIATLFTGGWAQQNLSTPIGTIPTWIQGNPTIFPAQSGADTTYILGNYNNVSGANTISNWLFTPVRTMSNGHTISFWTRTTTPGTTVYPDRMQVRLSTNGSSVNVGATNTSVGDYTTLLLDINPTLSTTGYPSVWTQYTATISGLAGPTAGRIAFRYFVTNGGPSGANSDNIGIDNVAYTVPVSADIEMVSADTLEYTITPENHQFQGPYTGVIRNNGTSNITGAFMRVNVYDGTNTQVYTANSATVATLAPGATATVTVPAAVGLAPDLYTIEYLAKHSAVDGNLLNDSLFNGVLVDPTIYARDNGNVIGSLGIGAGNGGYLGQMFHLNAADNIDSVLLFLNGGTGYTGEPIAACFWNIVAGEPGTIIGYTDTLFHVDDNGGVYVLPTHGGSLSLPAGDFVVTAIEFDSTLGLGLASSIFTLGTTWVNWPTSPAGGWANNEFFGVSGFNHPYVIRPILSNCPAYTSTTSSTQSACGATTGTATIAVGGGPGPFTYLWSNGNTNATATNLAAGNYTVTVSDGNGCTVSGSVAVTNPNAPTGTVVAPTPAPCFGGNGTAGVIASGGTPTYTYLWSNNATTGVITAPAGTYSVTVTDAAGCQVVVGPATITQPTAITSTVTNTQESAPGATDGSASVNAVGGTPPYTYLWSNGGTTGTITQLGAGSYSVTVTDANGCTLTSSTSVVVGIDATIGNVTFGAYPNPNDGNFQIAIGTIEPTDIAVEITDLMGKVVYSTTAAYATEFKREVNLGGQAAGIYVIRMKAGEVARTFKIEVKH